MLSSSRALIRSLTVCFRGYSFVGSGWFFFRLEVGLWSVVYRKKR
jgi:hypothetical protein